MGLMYEKPKKKKKRSNHITNPKITEPTICELCHKQWATQTHEVFGGNNRNKSIHYGAQLKVCLWCHDNWHQYRFAVLPHKQWWQNHIMNEEDWDLDRWRKEFGKNWFTEEREKDEQT